MSDKKPHTPRGKRPINLPFTDKKEDMGEWAYDHRVGLCVTIIAYLLLSIAFVACKIYVTTQRPSQGIYIDMQQLMELEQLRDELERQTQQAAEAEQMDWERVQNLRSNEASEQRHAERGTNLEQLQNEAQRLQQEMDDNRNIFDEGLSEAEALSRRTESTAGDDKRMDSKVEGNVTVSYSMVNPVRNAQRLVVPAYRCKGGGEVIVEIEVDRAGTVISSRIVRGGDDCMRESALSSARRSTFDSNPTAPTRQRGTISYIFIPQR